MVRNYSKLTSSNCTSLGFITICVADLRLVSTSLTDLIFPLAADILTVASDFPILTMFTIQIKREE